MYWRTFTGSMASNGPGGSPKNSSSFARSFLLSDSVRGAFSAATSAMYRSDTWRNVRTADAGGDASRSISAQRLGADRRGDFARAGGAAGAVRSDRGRLAALEVLADLIRHRAHGIDRGAKLVFRDVEGLGPIADLVLFVDVDARTVGLAAVFGGVGHDISRRLGTISGTVPRHP